MQRSTALSCLAVAPIRELQHRSHFGHCMSAASSFVLLKLQGNIFCQLGTALPRGCRECERVVFDLLLGVQVLPA